MQRGVVALAIAAAIVAVALVVLMVRVRGAAKGAPPPAEVAPPRASGEPARAPAASPPAPAPVADEAPADAPAEAAPAEAAPVEAAPPPPADGITSELLDKREAVQMAYDHGEYEKALRFADELLRAQPDNLYARRVAAISACATGKEEAARAHYGALAESHRRIVEIRCRRYGITL
jgi:hypothetical protein